jgi:hypothetical protein
MPNDLKPVSNHVERNTDPAAFAHWPDGFYEEMLAGLENGCVGSTLVSETTDMRVWHLVIPVGGRAGFHCHVNRYFWSAVASGKARGYFSSGEIRDVEHYVGETKHYNYGAGESMVHSVENIGDTELSFVTVEFLDGVNEAWPIPDNMRLKTPA